MSWCLAPEVSAWLILVLSAALVLLLGGWKLRSILRRWRIHRRQRKASRGEGEAAVLLERLGYTIAGAQVAEQYPLRCDGEDHWVSLRADYLLERAGRRYLAEVKTGMRAPQLTTPATRRQLLEYAHAYRVDGVLLVDMQERRVHEVEFPQVG